MKIKLFLSFIIALSLIFSFTFVFATEENNGLKDAMNATENTVEDAARGTVNAVKDTTRDATNAVSNVVNDVTGATRNMVNSVTADRNNTTNNQNNNNYGTTGNYSTERTATTAYNDEGTFMGMNSTTWIWIVMGVTAIAIIALVWYYSMQLAENNYNNHNE